MTATERSIPASAAASPSSAVWPSTAIARASAPASGGRRERRSDTARVTTSGPTSRTRAEDSAVGGSPSTASVISSARR